MGFFSSVMGNASPTSPAEVQADFANLFAASETVEAAYQLFRDMMIFTNRRLIIVDKEGLTGSKINYTSIPYKSIVRFNIETTGHFDLDAELSIWVSGMPEPIKHEFSKRVNIYDVQALLTTYVCK